MLFLDEPTLNLLFSIQVEFWVWLMWVLQDEIQLGVYVPQSISKMGTPFTSIRDLVPAEIIMAKE